MRAFRWANSQHSFCRFTSALTFACTVFLSFCIKSFSPVVPVRYSEEFPGEQRRLPCRCTRSACLSYQLLLCAVILAMSAPQYLIQIPCPRHRLRWLHMAKIFACGHRLCHFLWHRHSTPLPHSALVASPRRLCPMFCLTGDWVPLGGRQPSTGNDLGQFAASIATARGGVICSCSSLF